jgi:hypothetical protein
MKTRPIRNIVLQNDWYLRWLPRAAYSCQDTRAYLSIAYTLIAKIKMSMRLGLRTATLALVALAVPIDESQFDLGDVIVKDVAIVGGGAAGSHAAVRLRQDFTKSILLIDRAAQLVNLLIIFRLRS